MFKPLRKFLASAGGPRAPSVPRGTRVYALGDVHGRLDLLAALAEAIEDDDATSAPASSTVILLGDLIDRGADSRGVIAFVREWQRRRAVRVLCGNHEEMLLACMENPELLPPFLRYGGRETLESYGLDPDRFAFAAPDDIQRQMRACVPAADLAFLRGFEDSIVLGDYLFVHAGIRPQVPLERQAIEDLRWIREPFLSFEGQHEHVVVHGHTIAQQVAQRSNRIGIDTGAYLYGRLTALVLEGDERRFIAASSGEQGLCIEHAAARPDTPGGL